MRCNALRGKALRYADLRVGAGAAVDGRIDADVVDRDQSEAKRVVGDCVLVRVAEGGASKRAGGTAVDYRIEGRGLV